MINFESELIEEPFFYIYYYHNITSLDSKEKDDQVQKQIVMREAKLESLKEKSLRKESSLSAKEQELKALREKTRLMMQRAQAAEEDFKQGEKALNKTLSQKEKKSRMDMILAKANEKASAMKAEMRAKRLKDEDDNLLAFLRKSHKKGENIYNYLEISNDKENMDESAEPHSVSNSFGPIDAIKHASESVVKVEVREFSQQPPPMPLKTSVQVNSRARVTEPTSPVIVTSKAPPAFGSRLSRSSFASEDEDFPFVDEDTEALDDEQTSESLENSAPKEKLSSINLFLPSTSPKVPKRNSRQLGQTSAKRESMLLADNNHLPVTYPQADQSPHDAASSPSGKQKLSTINYFLPASPKVSRKTTTTSQQPNETTTTARTGDNHWNEVVESSIQHLEASIRFSESIDSDFPDLEESGGGGGACPEMAHYAERWSMSPSGQQHMQRGPSEIR